MSAALSLIRFILIFAISARPSGVTMRTMNTNFSRNQIPFSSLVDEAIERWSWLGPIPYPFWLELFRWICDEVTHCSPHPHPAPKTCKNHVLLVQGFCRALNQPPFCQNRVIRPQKNPLLYAFGWPISWWIDLYTHQLKRTPCLDSSFRAPEVAGHLTRDGFDTRDRSGAPAGSATRDGFPVEARICTNI